MVDIAKIILEGSDNKSKKSDLGMKIMEAAKKYSMDGIKETEDIIDDELRKKLTLLKESEDKNDLIWMNKPSWNALSPYIKRKFEENIDPLLNIHSGVYFSSKNFYEYKDHFFKLLDIGIRLAVLKDGNNKQLLIVKPEKSNFDMMSDDELEKLRGMYSRRVIETFDNSVDGWFSKVFRSLN